MAYPLRKVVAALVLMSMGGISQAHANECCYFDPQPCGMECGNFFVDAEFLYWRAFEGGLSNPCDIVEVTNTDEGGITLSRLKGKSHDPHFEWNEGFRVQIGYQLPSKSWDISASWTLYESEAKRENSGLKNKWHLDLDVVDLAFHYQCHPCDCFSLTPYAVVRYAQIDQHLHKHSRATVNELVETSRLKLKDHFWGVGPLLGLRADWNMGCGWGLYGNAAVGVLYGNFDVKTHLTTNLLDGGVNRDRLKSHHQCAEPVLDLGLGLRWSTCYWNNNSFVIHIGLEEQHYFDHNQFCGHGDLSVCGANIGACIQF